MNADTTLSLAIAALCVLAVGIAATTLDSSLSTDPDDVIDVEWDRLPISQEDAATVEREIRARQERQNQPSGGSEEESRSASEENAEEDSQGQRADSKSQSQDQQSQEQQRSRDQTQSRDSEPREPTFWEELLALLRELLPWLVALGVLAAGVALAYHYRERLRALAAVVERRSRRRIGAEYGTEWFAVEPATEIDRMWLQVVRHLDPDDPGTRTVTDIVDRAIEAGLDPDGVRELADVFREVRFGGVPVTEERKRRASDGFRELDLDGDRSGRHRDGRQSHRPSGGETA